MKGSRKILCKGLLLIGFVGTTLSFTIPIILMLVKQELGYGYEYFFWGLPFIVFIWPYGIHKSIKSGEVKYGIKFWGAIKHAPKWMIALFLIIGLGFVSSFFIEKELVLLWILPLFNYLALLMCLSGILEK